jgi:hypothetical protein
LDNKQEKRILKNGESFVVANSLTRAWEAEVNIVKHYLAACHGVGDNTPTYISSQRHNVKM